MAAFEESRIQPTHQNKLSFLWVNCQVGQSHVWTAPAGNANRRVSEQERQLGCKACRFPVSIYLLGILSSRLPFVAHHPTSPQASHRRATKPSRLTGSLCLQPLSRVGWSCEHGWIEYLLYCADGVGMRRIGRWRWRMCEETWPCTLRPRCTLSQRVRSP